MVKPAFCTKWHMLSCALNHGRVFPSVTPRSSILSQTAGMFYCCSNISLWCIADLFYIGHWQHDCLLGWKNRIMCKVWKDDSSIWCLGVDRRWKEAAEKREITNKNLKIEYHITAYSYPLHYGMIDYVITQVNGHDEMSFVTCFRVMAACPFQCVRNDI